MEMTQKSLGGLRGCSFCGKPSDQVSHLISGPDGVFICEGCVNLCRELLDELKEPVR
jgi:ATP-dependent protease Clp ATPase subunit